MRTGHRAILLFALGLLGAAPAARAASITYATEVLSDAPVAFWRFGEASGATAADSSGNGNAATYHDNVSGSGPTLGAAGAATGGDTAASFDGVDDYAVAPNSASFQGLLNYTLEAWIKISGSATADRRIVSQQNGGGYWLLHIVNNRLANYSSLDGISGVVKGPTLNDGAWHQIAITRDTVGGVATWWIDGASVGTQAIASHTAYNLGAPVFIGAEGDAGPGASIQFFPGSMDEVAVYNTALSAARIQAHFTANSLVAAVPEPASLLLLLLGGATLVRRRRA